MLNWKKEQDKKNVLVKGSENAYEAVEMPPPPKISPLDMLRDKKNRLLRKLDEDNRRIPKYKEELERLNKRIVFIVEALPNLEKQIVRNITEIQKIESKIQSELNAKRAE